MVDKIAKISAPKIRLEEFLNNLPEAKNGRVEFVGAFAYFMEHVKQITQDTESNFREHLEQFRTMPV